MSALDKKAGIVDGRRRVLTIHDGAPVTATLVRMLEVLADDSAVAANTIAEGNAQWARNQRGDAMPILVGRSDGIAVYVRDGMREIL